MKTTIIGAVGFFGAFFLSGLFHYLITGNNYATGNTEVFGWFLGTWTVFSLVTWIILTLFARKGSKE